MDVSGGGSKTTQTTVNKLDPLEQQWRESLYGATEGAAGAGPGASMTGANDYYKQMMAGGKIGNAALAGDTGAVNSLMNPYQQQVIDAMNKQFGNSNAQAVQTVNGNATTAGAFGGSRGAIAAGTTLSQNQLGQNSQIGGLLQSGFSDAMARAQGLASGGYLGAGQSASLGQMGVDNPDLWRMLTLRNGMMGTPYGTSTGTSGSSVNGSTSFGLFGGH